MTSSRIFALAPVLFVALAACSLGPTAQDVVDRSSPVVCDKAKQCISTFDLSFPGGTAECTTKVKAEAEKKYGGDLARHSTCTDDELETCLQKLKTAACPGGDKLPQPPCDC
jgi:hypothetical protein